jgi:hypothetical protein
MNARRLAQVVALGALALWPATAGARGLGVEVWTDRGDDAVYQPGDGMEVKARVSDDAYLMVYEIDAEGGVRLLYPFHDGTGFVEGRQTYPVPPERSNVELVVQGQVGQCYVVAIASREPYDMQADQVGYEGQPDEEEGITAEGRIVGDPFVAMERIRRRVLEDPEDAESFGSSFAKYYVHNEVRYPRYLCYDCHRPGYWAWWTGFDPYYASCSVFDFRVNWGWGWGPGYWFGAVPYYYYVPRYDCPPRYRNYFREHRSFSSWDGWRRWNSMWGDHLVRYKSDPPAGYVPPSRFPSRDLGRGGKAIPPGFLVGDVRKGREGFRPTIPQGRDRPAESPDREGPPRRQFGDREAGPGRQPAERMPMREARDDADRDRGTGRAGEMRGRGGADGPWLKEAPRGQRPREERPRDERPRLIDRPYLERRPEPQRPREERSHERAPEVRAPRQEPPRNDPPREKSGDSRGGDKGRWSDAPRGQRPRG